MCGENPASEGFWVAVLPFKSSGGNTEVTALAEGMTEEIVTGLSRFPYFESADGRASARGTEQFRFTGPLLRLRNELLLG